MVSIFQVVLDFEIEIEPVVRTGHQSSRTPKKQSWSGKMTVWKIHNRSYVLVLADELCS